MKYIVILIIGFFGCTTQKKAEAYFERNPEKANYVARQYINTFELPGAKICLDAFPQTNKIDTMLIVKDSLIVEHITDTLYKWLTDTKYVDKEKIRTILKPCRDSIKIVSKIIYDDKYKILYNDIKSKYDNMSDSHTKLRKSLFWTWFFIILIAGGAFLFKNR